MPSARTLCLAISLCACLSMMRPAFAQIQPRPDLHSRDETPPDQNRLVGFDAVAHQLAAELAKAGQKKVIVFDFHGMFWSPFAAWLADQFALSFGGAGDSIVVIERSKLAVYEPTEGFLFRPGTAKSRVALELGADTVVEGSYRPASNGVGVSLSAYRVSKSRNAATIDTSSIVSVNGYVPYTKEIGSKVYLPLDAVWTNESAPAGQRISSPSCIYCPNPQYSSEAHKKKVEGTVLLTAGITTDGRAVQIIVVKSLGSGLDEQAIADLQTWKFRPAMYADGRPIPVYCPIEVTFRLY
jgi:TonB family protein